MPRSQSLEYVCLTHHDIQYSGLTMQSNGKIIERDSLTSRLPEIRFLFHENDIHSKQITLI